MIKNKAKAKGGIFIIGMILATLAIPAGVLLYTGYFAWDSQLEGKDYKVAIEKDGKLYESNIQGSSLAFDQGTGDDHLYLNSFYSLGELIALSYDDYKIEKTDNPFFAGKAYVGDVRKYLDQQTKYTNPKDSYQSYKFFDRNRTPIFTFEPGMQSEFVQKLRPTFPAFSKRRYNIGTKQDYVDATRLLRAKINKNLRIRPDESNKLLILSFDRQRAG